MKAVTILVGSLLLTIAVSLFSAHPYSAQPGWGDIGREWGSTSAVYTTPEGNVWVAERCGQNSCVDRDELDTIFLFDPDGNMIRSFGAGLFVWPHGIHVDPDRMPCNSEAVIAACRFIN